jgi:predicted transcriptional regulator
MKEKAISIRLDAALRKALEDLAEQDHRKLSDYARLVLIRHVQDIHRASGKTFKEHKKEGAK